MNILLDTYETDKILIVILQYKLMSKEKETYVRCTILNIIKKNIKY